MLEGLNSSTGFGSGEGTAVGNNGSVALFGQLLARQQAKREREQQMLANELSQVKTDGLREPDRVDFFKQYQEVKNTAGKIPYEKDGWKRAQLKAEVDQKLLELNSYAQQSKAYGNQYKDFQSKLLDNKFRDQFNDQAITTVGESNKLPISDSRFVRDFNVLGRQVDAEKIDKMLGTLDGTMLKKTQWGNPVQTASKQGNKNGVMFYNKREVDPVEQLHAYANIYDAQPDFRKFIHDQYPDVFDGNNPEQAKALALKDYADKRRSTGILSEATAPQFKPNDSYYDHRTFMINNPIPKGESENVSAQPQDLNIRYGSGGKANVNVKGFIPISIPAKNFGGSTAYNLTDGTQNEVLQPSDNYSIVGVGNYPFVKGVSSRVDGSIAQPDFAKRSPDKVEYKSMVHVKSKGTAEEGDVDHLVDYSKLPENIKNSKSVKAALSNFKPIATETKQTPSTSGMVTLMINGQTGQIPADKVEAFLKKYPKAKRL